VYGANIPCSSTANVSQIPTAAITDYCRHNKNASFILMYVTGHETAVTWACQGKAPIVLGIAHTDGQGYASSNWRKVEP
jgi:hypothetical protein